ncbi:MAG: helix-turn-helix domain-containing protein [Cyclobacteriaceae bacterium]|nr:helix-turn-helix domain-containing protein [Cyclobacteriaceae bacterium]
MHDIDLIEVKDKLGDKGLFKISRFKKVIKKTKPHTHEGYYEVIYLKEGEGFHWIESTRYQVNTPECYILKPGMMHCWEFTDIPDGYVILFKLEYLDPIMETALIEIINQMGTTTRVPVDKDLSLEHLFEELIKTYDNRGKHSDLIIHSLLKIIYAKISVHIELSNASPVRPANLNDKFINLLNEKCPELRSVNDYAKMLNTSPQNLNAACRKYSGKSAGDLLAEKLLVIAKRYVLHTDNNMSEIAHVLRFNDASYFVKFFRKYTGVTPLQFRFQNFR